METVQQTLNDKLSKGESIAQFAIGYYLTAGNQYSPSLQVPIFEFKEQSRFNSMVLIDYLGSMMWINVRPENVFYGWCGKDRGKELRRKLEAIKCNN